MILLSLIVANVSGERDEAWTKNLRFYWDPIADDLKIEIGNLPSFSYGYEYLGKVPVSARTEFTEKCFYSLLNAYRQNLFGVIVGQAGIGKTETIRELARDLGQPCIVLNCSDCLDRTLLAQFMSGAAAIGAWTIYDEFNRIQESEVEAFQQMVHTLKHAKDTNSKNFVDVDLNANCAFFLTVCNSYVGRSGVPQSLKIYVNEIEFKNPDFQAIFNVMLFSKGFEESEDLSNRFIELFDGLKERLSKQPHYDLRFRCMEFIVNIAARRILLQKNSQENSKKIFVQSIKDVFIPRLTKEDTVCFEEILNEKFDGFVEANESTVIAIDDAIKKLGLKATQYLKVRVKAFLDFLEFKTGVIVIEKDGKSNFMKVNFFFFKFNNFTKSNFN